MAVPEDLFQTILLRTSPWQADPKVLDHLVPTWEPPLVSALAARILHNHPRRQHLIEGPRRVGKTTAMEQVARHLLRAGVPAARVCALRLDHPQLSGEPLGQLVERLLSRAPSGGSLYLLLDEVSWADGWDRWLKTIFDDRLPVEIIATTSATAALVDRAPESGIGRWEVHALRPWLMADYYAQTPPTDPLPEPSDDLSEALSTPWAGAPWAVLAKIRNAMHLLGGFPEYAIGYTTALTAPDTPDALRHARVITVQDRLRDETFERVIWRDIPQVHDIRDPLALQRLGTLLAAQAGGLFSPTNIAQQQGGLAIATIERYLHYLEQSHLVFSVPAWSANTGSVQRRGRKVYFVDDAVRSAVLGRGLGALDPDDLGPAREALVASHLHAWARANDRHLYHWRDGKFEVDFVVDDGRQPLAFEVGGRRQHHRNGLRALLSRNPNLRGHAWVVRDAPTWIPAAADEEGIGTIPLDALLWLVSRSADRISSRRLLPL